MSDVAPWRTVPKGKQVNEFTGELEDKAPLSLNPDPADQRRLSDGPADGPIEELNVAYMAGEIDLNGKSIPGHKTVPAQEEAGSDIQVQPSSDTGTAKDTAKPS